MVKVSIIVPIYNTEKYLIKCLDSLVNQTLTDIEILLINDGSTDNSQKIIDEYVKKYPNICRCFRQENSGQACARNVGINSARGDFIAFVDSDDYVDITAYEKVSISRLSRKWGFSTFWTWHWFISCFTHRIPFGYRISRINSKRM